MRPQAKGADLFNATAPIKFFSNLEDLTTLRGSFNAVCNNAIPEKQHFLGASLRLGSALTKDESKPKSADRTASGLVTHPEVN